MPLGNSIMKGTICTNGDIFSCQDIADSLSVGFRDSLYTMFTDSGYIVDFVGSETYGWAEIPDSNCAAFPGIRDNELADIMEFGNSPSYGVSPSPGPYLETFPADIVFLHIGTNDVLAGDTTDISDVERILDAIDSYELFSGNTVMVFLARIISQQGYDCGTHPGTVSYNARIDSLANARILAGDSLTLVDMECGAGLDYDNDLADQVHPNEDGYGKMANTWYPAIEEYIKNLTTHTITATAGPNGSIAPDGALAIDEGDDETYTITPDEGYDIADVLVDGGSLGPISTYTFPGVITDHTIEASFSIKTYTITASSGTNGSINPNGPVNVDHGSNQSFSFIPSSGYQVSGVVVDGSNQGVLSDYTFTDVTENHTISVSFTPIQYTISASAGPNGSISPSGNVTVNQGDNQTFNIFPATNYQIANVIIDGSNQGPISSHTFTNINDNHSISATFTPITHIITATAGANGSISPSGSVVVNQGSDRTFTITPAVGYDIQDVLVDGSSVGTVASYTFSDVDAAHTISVSFVIKTYNITATSGSNGSIDPSGVVNVNHGNDQGFTFNPDPGYQVFNVVVDGTNQGALSDYTFTNVTAPHNISVSFTPVQYTISAIAGPNGSITPSGPVIVNEGNDQTFTITPAPNYRIMNVVVDGNSQGPISSYTFTNITDNHSISATFTPITHIIIATAGVNGSISPSGSVIVNQGSSQSFTITPDAGYDIQDVIIDGSSIGAQSGFTFTNVKGPHTITASFIIKTYTITATAVDNGSISPSGDVGVNHGSDQFFSITPNSGYQISDVVIDGSSVGAQSSYTFNNVTANHSIIATFEPIVHTIEASSGPHGSINPDGTVLVNEGSDQTFIMTPSTGYEVAEVIVDGSSVGPLNSYTFNNITEDHTISVTFTKATYIITATAGVNGSISPAGDVEVAHGDDQSFDFIPDVGYEVEEVIVDGANMGAITGYTFNNVVEGHSISVSFSLRTYTISATSGVNGSISPSGNIVVDYASDQTFSFIPATGYEIRNVRVDGVNIGTPTEYSFTNVTANHNIFVSFILKTYIITATAGPNGSISPSGNIPVNHGSDQIFLITPDEGYEIDDVLVDGESVGPVASYTFTDVTEVHAISATFVLKTYTILATSDANGEISPSGAVVVDHGSDQTFIFTPSTGYEVDEVLVDGLGVGIVNFYTFTDITEGHTISVSFKLQTFTITSSAGPNGTISPLGDTPVTYGTDQIYTFTPDEGYEIEDVLVDGESIGAESEYTFTAVSQDHSISVSFILKTYIISATSGPNGSIDPPGDTEVDHGSDLNYTFTPDEGYEVEEVIVDGISLGPLTEYNFLDITEEHTISVSFILKTYLISAAAGDNGTIEPVGDTLIDHGSSITYTFTPDEGYEIEDVIVDGESVGIVPTYTFEDVTEEHGISVSFIIKTYVLSTITGPNGSISPTGDTIVEHGSSVTFTFLPDEGYEVQEVYVDGLSVVVTDEYTLENITMEHSIAVNFVLKTYIISVIQGENGTITPGIDTEVDHGSDLVFNISPDEGYGIEDVLVDGLSIGTPEAYLFPGITEPHSIEVQFVKVIEIAGAFIPNEPMAIGDTVTAIISVTTDVGLPYNLFSGEVGGYSLVNLQRVDFTTYTADFIVTSGGNSYTSSQSIPIQDLVLTDGEVQSDPFNDFINQNNDPVDASPPRINFMWVESGNKIVGETVRLIINTDGINYQLDSTSLVNGIPVNETNISFNEIGTGTYSLEYTVEEGDNDVEAGELTASVILIKPSGNVNIPYTTINNSSQLTIDANSPIVSKMEVPSEEFGVGDMIEVTITTDGEGYKVDPQTVINEIPLSSSRVSFVEQSGGTYLLRYTVAIGDNTVPAGDLEVSLVLKDAAGNSAGPFTKLEPNSLSVYTVLPTATIAGTQAICYGDEAELTVYLTGRSPWSIYVSDGTNSIPYNNIYNSNYKINVSPTQNTTYRIELVSDVNGTLNVGNGSAQVTVREKTDVEIINLQQTFSLESDPVPLEANIVGGIFTGPGVNSVTGIFDAEIADTVNSPHTIYYSYENPFGCISVDSALVFVLGANGDLFIPRRFYCDYQDPFNVTAVNVVGAIGSFRLLNNNDEEVEGLTDNGNNSAVVDPSQLVTGNYTVEYGYFDEVMLYLRESFMVETIEEPVILAPVADEFCQNDTPFALEGSIPSAEFEGPGVSGNIISGYIFDPSAADEGENVINLTNTSMDGCSKTASKTITINKVPDLSFEVDKYCVSSIDTIFFDNTTEDSYAFSSWEWDFDDPESGEENTSDILSPYHIFNESGPRTITLIGETTKGCLDTLRQNLEFGESPEGTFTWSNECYDEGSEVSFKSAMNSTNPIVKYEWTFIDSEGESITRTGSPQIQHEFDTIGIYTVQLFTETELGCTQMIEKQISLKPVITPGDERYLEQFTTGNGHWSAEQSDTSDFNSWNYNVVSFENMGDEISRAWYTRLPNAPVKEISWVRSPCFNFSETERPMIFMDIYRSLDHKIEGVVLEATTDGGNNWETVGRTGDGINWYNSSAITAGISLDSTGWTGRVPFASDPGWVSARHDLDDYAGEENVQFRVVFASGHESTEAGREGFAFDNVMIGSRNKKALIEHFTNTASPDTRIVTGEVNSLYNLNYDDAIKLEYHTSFPGSDPFNGHNPAVPAIRALYYGVSQVPYTMLDGGYQDELKFDHNSKDISGKDIKNATLMDGIFDIELITEYYEDNVIAEVNLTALRNLNAEERIIQVVVFEKLITDVPAENGSSNFLNVVKAMLPNAAGTAVFDGWAQGQTRTYQYSWDFTNVYDPEMIRVAAFIQNDETKEVYQVVADDTTNLTTADKQWNLEASYIKVYPNPATDYLFVQPKIDPSFREDYVVELLDQMGRVVISEEMYSYEDKKQIDLEALNKGVYFVRVRARNGVLLNVTKLVIMN